LVVDDPVGAKHEAGDLIQAKVDWTSVFSLANALAGELKTNAPIVFKSVGCAAWDLAACRVARQALDADECRMIADVPEAAT
jgi:1-piperideine-2-carboxylate/1-pyrroline-2-carboxylate reductase [NAD(P)H]